MRLLSGAAIMALACAGTVRAEDLDGALLRAIDECQELKLPASVVRPRGVDLAKHLKALNADYRKDIETLSTRAGVDQIATFLEDATDDFDLECGVDIAGLTNRDEAKPLVSKYKGKTFPAAAGAAPSRTTVTDYFLALPSGEAFGWLIDDGTPPSPEERKKKITVKDEGNGYLEFRSSGAHPASVALFKKKDGQPLIGVAMPDGQPGRELIFFEPTKDGASWREVTKRVMPRFDSADLAARIRQASAKARSKPAGSLANFAGGSLVFYRLPRKGTTLRAVCGHDEGGLWGIELFELPFNGERFVDTAPRGPGRTAR